MTQPPKEKFPKISEVDEDGQYLDQRRVMVFMISILALLLLLLLGVPELYRTYRINHAPQETVVIKKIWTEYNLHTLYLSTTTTGRLITMNQQQHGQVKDGQKVCVQFDIMRDTKPCQ